VGIEGTNLGSFSFKPKDQKPGSSSNAEILGTTEPPETVKYWLSGETVNHFFEKCKEKHRAKGGTYALRSVSNRLSLEFRHQEAAPVPTEISVELIIQSAVVTSGPAKGPAKASVSCRAPLLWGRR
jgi:hypothetical protein